MILRAHAPPPSETFTEGKRREGGVGRVHNFVHY